LSEVALDFVSELVKVFRRLRHRREESWWKKAIELVSTNPLS
jgi:hypothetical protein